MERKDVYTTYEVSKICGVTMRTVADWMDSGRLKSFKTLGGHRRVQAGDMIIFLKENGIPLPRWLCSSAAEKILVVDDEKAIVDFVKKTIAKKRPGCVVATAYDGFVAGQKTLSFLPALVILDLNLPGLDGFEVCRNIKSDSETKLIKILAITAFPTAQTRKKIMDCGADDYLEKPFLADDLAARLEKLLGRPHDK